MARPKKQVQNKVYGLGRRAVLYLRVSGDEQAKEGYGLEDQEDKARGYCELHGYEIVDVVRDEGMTGDTPINEREGLPRALEMCRKGDVDVLVTKAQDRLARDTEIWPQIRKAARQAGVRIETVKEGDLTAVGSEFMGDIYAAVAAQERRTIVERVAGGREKRSKRDGLGSGPTPWGYTKLLSGTVEHPVVTIDINQAAVPTICRVLTERAKGTGYQAIADSLKADGIEKPNGGTDWNVGNIQKIEKHADLYRTGIRTWGNVTATEKWPVIMSEDVLLPA
jgi:site-specific DNA recombinase